MATISSTIAPNKTLELNLTESQSVQKVTTVDSPLATPTSSLGELQEKLWISEDDSEQTAYEFTTTTEEQLKGQKLQKITRKRKRKSSPIEKCIEWQRNLNDTKIRKPSSPNLQSSNYVELTECERTPDKEPKITRAKAQALNKKIFNLPSLHAPIPPREMQVLIGEEFQSDDEDEEYQPCEDEIHSDDEPNTTISDIDSLPRTPYTPRWLADEYTDGNRTPILTNDGLFKIPKDRLLSCSSQTEQDYIIAQRTRSKVSLATIPIEEIESVFNPPDIPFDMLQPDDHDGDNNWMEFLNVLSKPLAHGIEEDDDGDPEYICTADKIPVDKEELRDVNISKKEFNDMIEELIESIGDADFGEYESILEIPPSMSKTKTGPRSKKSSKSPGDLSTTPNEPFPYETSIITSNQISFQPTLMSTPNAIQSNHIMDTMPNINYYSNNNNNNSQMYNSMQQSIGMYSSDPAPGYFIPNNSLLNSNSTISSSDYQVSIPMGSLNPYQGAYVQNGIIQLPQYQQVVVMVPTVDILKYNNSQQSIVDQQIQNTNQIKCDSSVDGGVDPTTTTTTTTTAIDTNTVASMRQKYQQKLYKHLHQDLPPTKDDDETKRGFTDFQCNILDQQLRMHVQFATQTFIQIHRHPVYLLYAERFKNMLFQLYDELAETVDQVCNLKGAVDMIMAWECELEKCTNENTEYFQFLKAELEQYIKTKNSYLMKFHGKFFTNIINSPVFIYPDLLPKIPFRHSANDNKKIAFLPIEDYLLAMALERFYNKRNQMTTEERGNPLKKVTLCEVCRDIAQHYHMPEPRAKALYPHMKVRRLQKDLLNPIQYYFLHNSAPKVNHELIMIDRNNMICPLDQSLGSLPYVWAKYVEQIKAVEHDKLLNPNDYICKVKSTSLTQSVAPQIRKPVCRNLTNVINEIDRTHQNKNEHEIGQAPLQQQHQNQKPQDQQQQQPQTPINPIQITIQYGATPSTKSNPFVINIPFSTPSTLNPSPISISNSANDLPQNTIKIDSPTTTTITTPSFGSFENLTPPSSYSCTDTINDPILPFRNPKQIELIEKLYSILKHHHDYENDDDLFGSGSGKNLIRSIYKCLRTFEIYTELVFYAEMSTTMKRTKQQQNVDDGGCKKLKETDLASTSASSGSAGGTFVPDNIVQNVNVEKDSVVASSVVQSTKKTPKCSKNVDNLRLLMPQENDNDKDFIFAQNFMDKVEETYRKENIFEKFEEFQEILRKFHPTKEKVADLYSRIENVFQPDHPELAGLFLEFLLPSQAAQCGKFIEHFMLTNMSNFLNKLNIYFNKQPAQVRKILTCLNELSEEENLKMEQIKMKILPLLKGNALLTEWFLQCFPSEQYPDSKQNEYESLSLQNAIETIDDVDVYEHLPQTAILPDVVESVCHLRYMNGRVYYGNRITLPGKLSFMNSDAVIDGIGVNVDATTTTNSGDNKSYRCVHNIKQYGDARIKDAQRTTHADQEHGTTMMATVDDSGGGGGGVGDHIIDDEHKRNTDPTQLDGKTKLSEPPVPLNCDEITLKAHAVRLNPLAHASASMTSEDSANILKYGINSDRFSNLERESLLKSPKKMMKSINSIGTTKTHRRSPKSPTVTPTTTTTTTPATTTTSTATATTTNASKKITSKLTSTDITTATVCPSKKSPAVQMAKKLKKMIEGNKQSDNNRKKTVTKRKRKNKPNSKEIVQDNAKKMDTKKTEINKFKNDDDDDEIDDEDDDGYDNYDDDDDEEDSDLLTSFESKSTTPPPIEWSRDEDKIILEHIKRGHVSETELVRNVQMEIKDRTELDINERFKFLMDVIATIRNNA